MDRALQDVGAGQEVRVEDEDVLPLGDVHAVLERAGLETRAVDAMNMGNVQARGPQGGDFALDEFARVGRGIVEHLDFEPFPRIIEGVDGAQQPLGDVTFVKDGQLDRDHRQPRKRGRGLRRAAAVLQKEIDDPPAMNAVRRETEQNRHVAERPQNLAKMSGHKLKKREGEACALDFPAK